MINKFFQRNYSIVRTLYTGFKCPGGYRSQLFGWRPLFHLKLQINILIFPLPVCFPSCY